MYVYDSTLYLSSFLALIRLFQPLSMILMFSIFSCVCFYRSYRYAAYRQFTWWMHGWLGRKVRRIIPSCSVKKIRSVYPEANGLYTGFKTAGTENSEVDEAWEDFYDF